MRDDYTIVTEVGGIRASTEQMARLHHRYAVGAEYCEGKRVLEVACGAGLGLGYLASSASSVVGGDYTANLVRQAQNHYHSRVGLARIDAHALPFRENSFDVVVLFEALYYLKDPDTFIEECRRVLIHDGKLVLCSVNREWPGFNPSPFSTRYFSAAELSNLLERHRCEAALYTAFPVNTRSPARKLVSVIKRAAVAMHLIPSSMKGKEWLKRIFYGKLASLPPELPQDSGPPSLDRVTGDHPITEYEILYAIARFR